MARMPDGFVLITNVSGPKVKDGQAYADVSLEERELVMCRNCKCYNRQIEYCYRIGCSIGREFFCADGERRDAADDCD
jgi:hypothetical protein